MTEARFAPEAPAPTVRRLPLWLGALLSLTLVLPAAGQTTGSQASAAGAEQPVDLPADWQGPAGLTVVASDEAGTPLPGVLVLLRRGDATSAIGAQTGDSGRVDVSGLATGEWQIELQREGFMLVSAYVKLEPGKAPEVAFSSRQRTGSYWAPLEVRFLPLGVTVTPAMRVGGETVAEARKEVRQEERREEAAQRRRERRFEEGRQARVVTPPPAPPAPAEPAAAAPSPVAPTPGSPRSKEGEAEAVPTASAPELSRPRVGVGEAPRPAPPPVATAPAPAADSGPRLLPNPDLLPAGACPECRPGEWSVTATRPAPASSTCGGVGAELEAVAQAIGAALGPRVAAFAGALRAEDGNDVLRLLDEGVRGEVERRLAALDPPGSSCAVVGVVLPAGARYIGFRYQAADRGTIGECLPEQDCQVGEASWRGTPTVLPSATATLVYGVFENRSDKRERSARLTVYFEPPRGWLPPSR